MAERQSLGRKKIEIAKIQNPTHLQVTFSKRRAGIFKKASELSILCGVEVALIIFSPGKKVFTFGHPNMETVVEDFLGHDNQPPPPVNLAQQIEQMIEASQYDRVSALIMQLRGLEAMREDQKKKGENIDRIAKENVEAQGWMRGPYDELNLQQLATLKKGMEVLLKDLHQKAQQLVMEQVHGDGGGGGDVGGSAAASAFPINTAYTPSGIMVFPPGGGGGDGDVGVGGGADVGGSAAASAFPINAAYTPRGIMVFPPGGGGGGAADSGFPDNAYMPSGAMVFPPGGGGGVGGDTAASGFPANAYMPSGGMVFPLGGGGGAAADSCLPDNAYMPSGGMIFPPGGSGGAGGGAAASVFRVDAYMPGGFNDASTSGASGSGANLGNEPEFF